MAETEYRLDTFVSVTLDTNGTGTSAPVGPVTYGESWHVERMSASGPSRARLEVYRGATLQTKIDGTDRANNDTSETNLTLNNGEVIVMRYSNGVPGAVMSVHIEGTRKVRGRRAY